MIMFNFLCKTGPYGTLFVLKMCYPVAMREECITMPKAIFSQHKTKLSTRNSALKTFSLLAAKYGNKKGRSVAGSPFYALSCEVRR